MWSGDLSIYILSLFHLRDDVCRLSPLLVAFQVEHISILGRYFESDSISSTQYPVLNKDYLAKPKATSYKLQATSYKLQATSNVFRAPFLYGAVKEEFERKEIKRESDAKRMDESRGSRRSRIAKDQRTILKYNEFVIIKK
jgi:hypothetical protein